MSLRFVGILLFPIVILSSACLLIPSAKVKREILSYKFENTDTLVDIGCGNGYHDYQIALIYPRLYMILEDFEFDSKNNSNKKHINSLLSEIPRRYRFVTGAPDSIPLGSSIYKAVLCRKTLHEFVYREKMVQELERILQKDGILIIEETEPIYYGEIDKHCKNQYLSKPEIITIFSRLKLIEETSSGNKRRKMNILKFRKETF